MPAEIFFSGGAKRLIAARLVFDLDDITAGHDIRAPRVQRKAQHVKHARRLIGQGIDLAGIFGDGQKTEALKKCERPSDIEAFQRKARKLRLLPVVVREPDVAVGEIAPAVAGGKKLFADAALPLEKRD